MESVTSRYRLFAYYTTLSPLVTSSNGFYCGKLSNLRLLGSLSFVFRGSTVRHTVFTKWRSISKFGRVKVTTKLDQLFLIVTDFQSEQLNYDRRQGSNPQP